MAARRCQLHLADASAFAERLLPEREDSSCSPMSLGAFCNCRKCPPTRLPEAQQLYLIFRNVGWTSRFKSNTERGEERLQKWLVGALP
jgi:hypothetical protein